MSESKPCLAGVGTEEQEAAAAAALAGLPTAAAGGAAAGELCRWQVRTASSLTSRVHMPVSSVCPKARQGKLHGWCVHARRVASQGVRVQQCLQRRIAGESVQGSLSGGNREGARIWHGLHVPEQLSVAKRRQEYLL